jgi:hypothetical protein
MKVYLHSFLICCCLLYGPFLSAQHDEPEIRLARQLDSLSATNRLSRHFARLYTETVLLSLKHYQSAGSRERDFLRRFETAFADLFFQADASQGKIAGGEAWTAYYSDTSRSPLQYQLLGINAHINADLSVALINGFSLDELRIFRKDFIRFQRGLRQQFHWFFEDNISTNPTTRIIGQFPLGLTRTWGSSMMRRWRKRQFRIAVTHYTDPEKSAKLRRKTVRAKERTDRLILRYL